MNRDITCMITAQRRGRMSHMYVCVYIKYTKFLYIIGNYIFEIIIEIKLELI